MAYHGAQVHLTSLVDTCRVDCEESDLKEEVDVLESLDENCSAHPTFPYSFYCNRHQTLVCSKCTKFRHQKALCQCDTIEKVSKYKRNQLMEELRDDKDFNTRISELEIFEAEKKKEEKLNNKLENEVINYKDKCIESLSNQKHCILKELTNQEKKFHAKCKEAELLLTEQRAAIISSQRILKQVSVSEDLEFVIDNVEKIESMLNSSMKERVTLPNVVEFSLLESNVDVIWSPFGKI